jgi:hypothetical protein
MASSAAATPPIDSTVPDLPADNNDDDSYISLTSHANQTNAPIVVNWGELDPSRRKPVIATNRNNAARNAIGGHSGSYIVYRALAVASGALDTTYMPNYKDTTPRFKVGPYPQWSDPKKIATIDPFGHTITDAFGDYLKKGPCTSFSSVRAPFCCDYPYFSNPPHASSSISPTHAPPPIIQVLTSDRPLPSRRRMLTSSNSRRL